MQVLSKKNDLIKLKIKGKFKKIQIIKFWLNFYFFRNNVYRPPVFKDSGNRFDSSRTNGQRGSNYDSSSFKSGDRSDRSAYSGFNRRNDNYDASNDTSNNWRDTSRVSSTYTFNQNNRHSEQRSQNNSEPVISKAVESDNWRSAKKSSTSTTVINSNTTDTGKKMYVPPPLRKKHAENV